MRRLTVQWVNQNCAYVSGHGSRELITDLRGRPPVWSCFGHAWVVQPRTARDVIAVAERRGFDVTELDGDPVDLSAGLLW